MLVRQTLCFQFCSNKKRPPYHDCMIERFSFCLFVYYLHKPVICKVGLLPPEPVRSYIRQFQGVSSCRHHCPSRPLKLLLLLPQQISLLELLAVNFQMMNPERLHTLYSPDKSNRHRTSICPAVVYLCDSEHAFSGLSFHIVTHRRIAADIQV